MILIAGAMGFLGREDCRRQARQGLPVGGLAARAEAAGRAIYISDTCATIHGAGHDRLLEYMQQGSRQRPLAPVAH